MKTNLHFTSCIGRVVQSATFIKTFTNGGGGGTGFGRVVKPVWVHTNHVRRVEFIVQDSREGEYAFWMEGYDEIFLRDGQHVAVLSANGRPVRVANFTFNQTYNLCGGEELIPKKKAPGFWASVALVYGVTMAMCYLVGGILTVLGVGAQPHAERLFDRVGSVGNPVFLLLLVAVAVRLAWGVLSSCRRAARVRLADQELADAWNHCLTLPQAMASLRVP